jgi:hypothetical protein
MIEEVLQKCLLSMLARKPDFQNLHIRYTRLVSKHLRTERRLNPHTLFLCLKHIPSPSPRASHAAKIAQFCKELGGGGGRIYGGFGVMGLVFSDG